MKKIIETVKNIFGALSIPSEEERMHRFLSQAQSHAQLEALIRIWDERHRKYW
jgi:hypothetical protein